MTYSLFILAAVCATITTCTIVEANAVVLTAIVFFQFVFQITLGTYLFVYYSQIAGETINSVATFCLWTTTLIINTLMPYMIDGMGASGTFAVFAICSLIGGIINVIFMRDTKGLTKE